MEVEVEVGEGRRSGLSLDNGMQSHDMVTGLLDEYCYTNP